MKIAMKIFLFLICSAILSTTIHISTPKASATSHIFNYFPVDQGTTCPEILVHDRPLTTKNTRWIDFTFYLKNATGKYRFFLYEGSNAKYQVSSGETNSIAIYYPQTISINPAAHPSSEYIRVENLYSNYYVYPTRPPSGISNWKAGNFKLELFEINGNDPNVGRQICYVAFTVFPETNISNQCNITIYPGDGITPNTGIYTRVSGLPGDPDRRFRIELFNNKERLSYWCNPKSDLFPYAIYLGERPVGEYRIEVKEKCDTWFWESNKMLCKATYTVTETGGSAEAGSRGGPLPPARPPTDPCYAPQGSPQRFCNTALGQINVSTPTQFVTTIFSFILGIGGAATLILLIYAGYVFMTSRGDKQKIAGARETITSAITGLIFIVLAIAILGFLGASLFDIPGFG